MNARSHCSEAAQQSLRDDLLLGYRNVNRHACLFLQRLREFDLEQAYREPLEGGKTFSNAPAWLHAACGIDQDAAREKLSVAYALLNLPRIEDAFERGDLSFRKVRALATIATAMNEAALLDFASATTDAQVAAYCEAQEPSAGVREGALLARREPSAGEREGIPLARKEPSAGEREGAPLARKEPSAGAARTRAVREGGDPSASRHGADATPTGGCACASAEA